MMFEYCDHTLTKREKEQLVADIIATYHMGCLRQSDMRQIEHTIQCAVGREFMRGEDIPEFIRRMEGR